MALALENTENILNKDNISIGQYTHTRKDIALRLLEQLKLLRFVGVSVSSIARSRGNKDVPQVFKHSTPIPSSEIRAEHRV